MGFELAKAFVRVRADHSNISSDFQRIRRDVDSEMRGINADTNKSFQEMGSSAETMGTRLREAMKGIGIGAAALFVPAHQAMKGFMDEGIKRAEQFETNFTDMLRLHKMNEDATKKTMADLTQFAVETPFEMPELIGVAKQLIPQGITGEKLIDTLRLLGDASGGTARQFRVMAKSYQDVIGANRLMTREYYQLMNAGILTMKDLTDSTGKSVKQLNQMFQTGAFSAEMFKKVIKDMTSEGGRNFNAMAMTSKTLGGLTSTWTDAYGTLSRMMVQSLIPSMKKVLELKIKMVDALVKLVNLYPGMSSGALVAASAFMKLGIALTVTHVALKFFQVRWTTFIAGFAGAAVFTAAAAALGAFVGWFVETKQGIEAIAEASKALQYIWEKLKEAGISMLNNFKDLFEDLFGVTIEVGARLAADVISQFIDDVMMYMTRIADAIAKAADAVGIYFRNSRQYIAILLIDIETMAIKFVDKVVEGFWSLVNAARSAFEVLKGEFKIIWEHISDGFARIWSGIKAGFNTLMDNLSARFNSWWTMRKEIFMPFSDADDDAASEERHAERVRKIDRDLNPWEAIKKGMADKAFQQDFEFPIELRTQFIREQAAKKAENLKPMSGGSASKFLYGLLGVDVNQRTAALQAEKTNLQQQIAQRELTRRGHRKGGRPQRPEWDEGFEPGGATDEAKTPSPSLDIKAGRFGFAEFGNSFQDAALKDKDYQAQILEVERKALQEAMERKKLLRQIMRDNYNKVKGLRLT